MRTDTLEAAQTIYTVSQLNSAARVLLEDCFPFVWVEGEISNFAAPHSGHWYFCLKDVAAQVRCAMFRGNQRKIGFTPKDGDHVLIKARVSLYENRGEYQLIAESMEERGEGKLRQAFETLKKKLEATGLFLAEHKKPLPPFPQAIGIITSPTGAAIRDILTVLKRRYPVVPIIIYPTLVQGAKAAPNIVSAITRANARNECDLLILSRGGGSIEDLWPFNEESVAYAIYSSALAIISGVGHEIDFTIADFVADKRAPTPSAAAEIATPDAADLLHLINRHQQHIVRNMQKQRTDKQLQLQYLEKRLAQQHPKRRLFEKMQSLDHHELKLKQLVTNALHQQHHQLNKLEVMLKRYSPTEQIQTLKQRLLRYQQMLQQLLLQKLQQRQLKLANVSARLDTLSPLATLKRGYAIAMTADNHIITQASSVQSSSTIEVKLNQGSLVCVVEKIL